MTREETLKIMSVLKGAYPNYYRGMQREEANGVVALWTEMLADYPAEVVALAVKRFIALDDKGFPPSIGQVIQGIRAVASPPEDRLTENEAWGLCRRAACNGAYNSKSEYAKLPPILQRVVGSPEVIHEWSQMDPAMLDTTVRASVCRSFNAAMEREEEAKSLPPALNSAIHRLAGQMAIESQSQQELRLEDSASAATRHAQAISCPAPKSASGVSSAAERFLEALRGMVENKGMSRVEEREERNRAIDAEQKARAEAQYQQLKAREARL